MHQVGCKGNRVKIIATINRHNFSTCAIARRIHAAHVNEMVSLEHHRSCSLFKCKEITDARATDSDLDKLIPPFCIFSQHSVTGSFQLVQSYHILLLGGSILFAAFAPVFLLYFTPSQCFLTSSSLFVQYLPVTATHYCLYLHAP